MSEAGIVVVLILFRSGGSRKKRKRKCKEKLLRISAETVGVFGKILKKVLENSDSFYAPVLYPQRVHFIRCPIGQALFRAQI